ncbi:4-hydroxy-3-methylbut-2-enyl diphosphate reductase [Clostridium cavendishii DSM 21758]|uniref:4-hydroxy-3-methylbut-2-enyl diphosphate reductase n=2 Tax=Clostridium TaxID=1485 RepID=A0A1M6FJD5_9CLOT|nr:4-hydroxy-3-methylbut-2-enyl diphosphate reductase [Clostridium cavendishii DSM 21758]
MRKVELAEHAGFCFGVKRAVDESVKTQKQYNKKIYTLGPLIHNNDMVKFLEKNNIFAINLEDVEKLEAGEVIVIRSHGVRESTIKYLEDKGMIVVNATCPFVTNIQIKANKHSKDGYKIIIIGDENHPEVQGVNGWCDDSALITMNGEFDFKIPNKVCVVCQTTQKKEIWTKTINKISENAKEILAFNTICSATEVRQKSADDISKKVDVMIVVGGKESSNTIKLYEICKKNCERSYHIENVNELDMNWLYKDDLVVGVTAGASTPDWIIKEVIKKIQIN